MAERQKRECQVLLIDRQAVAGDLPVEAGVRNHVGHRPHCPLDEHRDLGACRARHAVGAERAHDSVTDGCVNEPDLLRLPDAVSIRLEGMVAHHRHHHRRRLVQPAVGMGAQLTGKGENAHPDPHRIALREAGADQRGERYGAVDVEQARRGPHLLDTGPRRQRRCLGEKAPDLVGQVGRDIVVPHEPAHERVELLDVSPLEDRPDDGVPFGIGALPLLRQVLVGPLHARHRHLSGNVVTLPHSCASQGDQR